MLPLILLLLFAFAFPQKVYVVERERGSVAVIADGKLKKEIGGLGNTNHATLKFYRNYAYVVSRDGYLSQIDTSSDILLKKVRVGKSTIGFTFCSDGIAVANYSPHTVVLLSPDLKVLKTIRTGSRNVGIKAHGRLLIFSLMDMDEIWAVDCLDFKKVKVVHEAGSMPFDALLSGNRYIVGFFKESSAGILNLKDMSYRKVSFGEKGGQVVFKIPHFGLWGVYENRAYIPAVGDRRLHVVDLDSFRYITSVELPGLPVFVSVSPDGRYLGVNYSGDKEDFFTLIDRRTLRVLETKRLGRRILHFRFSPDGRFVYISSYYENKLKKISIPDLKVLEEIAVPTPSGVFIKGG